MWVLTSKSFAKHPMEHQAPPKLPVKVFVKKVFQGVRLPPVRQLSYLDWQVALASSVSTWQNALQRSVAQAQKEKHLTDKADPLQVAFEIHGLILALHYEARFLRNPGAADRARKGFSEIVVRNQA